MASPEGVGYACAGLALRAAFMPLSRQGAAPSTCRLEAGGSSAELRGCGDWRTAEDLHPAAF